MTLNVVRDLNKLYYTQSHNNNKTCQQAKYHYEDKENLNSLSQSKAHNLGGHQSTQGGSSKNILNQVLAALTEIKNQNAYLLERQHELEFIIEQDLKVKLDDGITQLRSDIKGLKKQYQQSNDQQAKRFKQINYSRRKRFASSKQLIRDEQGTTIQIQEEEVIDERSPEDEDHSPVVDHELDMGVSGLQLEGGAESTFMRNLEQTQAHIHQSESMQCQQPDMRMSLGANLLQMMQFNNPQPTQPVPGKKPKRQGGMGMRNFNFRCNLEEIDKIIEEETQEIQNNGNDTSMMNLSPYGKEKSPMEQIKEINKSIERENQQVRERSHTPNRPSTASKQPRKAWNKKETSTEVTQQQQQIIPSMKRPQTAVQQGIRIKRIAVSKKENEDPILALLRQDSTDNTDTSKQIIEEEEKEPAKEEIFQANQAATIIVEFQPPEPKLPPVSPKNLQKEESKVIKQFAGVKMPIKRGFFKAPPPNLIESLLLEDSQDSIPSKKEASPMTQKSAQDKSRENRFIKINNFLCQSEDKAASRSRSRKMSNNQRLKGILLADEDDQVEGDEEENPFNNNSTLIKGGQTIEKEDQDVKMMNLFFNRKNQGGHGDTAEFGK